MIIWSNIILLKELSFNCLLNNCGLVKNLGYDWILILLPFGLIVRSIGLFSKNEIT